MAKHAWRAGRFRLDREGERLRVAGNREVRREAKLRRGEIEEKDQVSGECRDLATVSSATSLPAVTDAFDFLTTAQDDDKDVEMLEFGNEMSSGAGDCDMPAADAEAVRCDSAADVKDVEKEEEKIDPFKVSPVAAD